MKIKKNFKNLLLNLKLKKKFKDHNKLYFPKNKNSKDGLILVELNKLCDIHILYSYITNILAKKYNSQIVGFNTRYFASLSNHLIFIIKKFFNLDYFSIYRSFNVDHFFYPKKKFVDEQKVFGIIKNLKSKRELQQLQISSIKIGDLLYDAYLKRYNLATVNLKDKKLFKFTCEFFSLFYFWEYYFKSKKIKAVIIGDTAYEYGIISRISILKNIPTYIGATTRLHRLNKNNLNIFEMRNYKEEFELYEESQKNIKLNYSKTFVEKKFLGKKTIENKVSNLPEEKLFGDVKFNQKVIKNKNRVNCLIAAHHFSDAPNVWGEFLFADFYEWVDFLGKLSNNLDYDWYIKLHPMDYKENKKIIDYFLSKYKNFNLVPKNTSHTQLISEGAKLVLTVYGTIGFEYAYHSIPVINASQNNPHISYGFNLAPKSIADYENSIRNYRNLKFNFDKKLFYEYYYMRYINNFYLFSDELSLNSNRNLEQIDDHSPEVYKKWFKLFSENEHKNLNMKITKFIKSGNYRYKEDELLL